MADVMESGMNTSNFASKAVAGSGLGLGIAGTVLGLMSGGLGNLGWGNNSNGNGYVTQDQASKSAEIALLNSKIAILEADKATDAKILDAYKESTKQNNALELALSTFRGDQAVINANFGSQIAVANSNIACIQNTLNSLTKVVIPSTNICSGSTTSTT